MIPTRRRTLVWIIGKIAADVTLFTDASSSPTELDDSSPEEVGPGLKLPTLKKPGHMLLRTAVASLLVGTSSFAGPGPHAGRTAAPQPVKIASPCRSADSAAVIGVAKRFHEILSTGDTAGINALLHPDLRVIEAGTVENRQEYLSHHLAADIEFSKAVKEERSSFSSRCEGNVAWLVTTSNSTGRFGGRDISSKGAELMLLSRNSRGWRIRAIHWSSAKRQSG